MESMGVGGGTGLDQRPVETIKELLIHFFISPPPPSSGAHRNIPVVPGKRKWDGLNGARKYREFGWDGLRWDGMGFR